MNELVAELPSSKQSFTRKDWEKNPERWQGKTFKEDGSTIMLTVNYKCDGEYSDKQKVNYLGLLITVWHPKSSMASVSDTLKAGFTVGTLRRKISQLKELVLKECIHSRAEPTGGGSTCDLEYHCPDCNATYRLDSSD